jgi:hypothetical protein
LVDLDPRGPDAGTRGSRERVGPWGGVAGRDRALLDDGHWRVLGGQAIADKLGINRSTVHRLLGRVLKGLRRELR